MCRRRTNYARSRLQKLVEKARKGFFDSLYPAGFPAGLVVILNLPPSGKGHRPEGSFLQPPAGGGQFSKGGAGDHGDNALDRTGAFDILPVPFRDGIQPQELS